MFIKSSLYGVLTLLSTTSAFALSCVNDYGGSSSCAGSTQAAGDCTTLGYFKNNVDGCEHYLYCPFDTSYKRCVSLDCTTYTLSSCPSGATSCASCQSGSSTKYKINGCKSGYVVSDNTCVTNPCTGYPLTSCPSGATSCSSCQSGSSTKYKINGCKSGYIVSDNTCVTNPCTGYPLTSCQYMATSCSTCQSGSSTKYKADGCWVGYVVSDNTCVADPCTGYDLTSCPYGGMCDRCRSGTETKFKLVNCDLGFILRGSTCVAKTCETYGAMKAEKDWGMPLDMYCTERRSYLCGYNNQQCWIGCRPCSELGGDYNVTTFCQKYPGSCYIKARASSSLSGCTIYRRASCSDSRASRCMSN